MSARDGREGSILLVLPTLHVGGAERLVEWTAPLLRDRGFRVAVLTLFDDGPCADALRSSGIPLYSSERGHRFYATRKRLPTSAELFAWPGLLSGLRRDAREAMRRIGRRGVLHAHCGQAQLSCRGAARAAPGWAYIETFHLSAFSQDSDWLKNRARPIMLRYRLRHVELGLCCGGALMESLRVGLPAWAPLVTIKNGIPLPPAAEQRPEVDDSRLDRAVVFVGSGKPQKNLAGLAAAFDIVGKRLPRTKLILCGKIEPSDLVGPGFPPDAAERLIADGRIAVSGVVDCVSTVLQRTKVACLVSRWEALPIAGLEMLFHGNNVVLSDIPPHREISRGGRYAWLTDPEEPQEMAAALEDALTHAVDERLVSERRSWVRENYSLERHVDALADTYDSLLNGDGPRTS